MLIVYCSFCGDEIRRHITKGISTATVQEPVQEVACDRCTLATLEASWTASRTTRDAEWAAEYADKVRFFNNHTANRETEFRAAQESVHFGTLVSRRTPAAITRG